MMTVGRGKKGIWDGKEGDSRRGKEGYAEESEGGGETFAANIRASLRSTGDWRIVNFDSPLPH